MWRDTRIYAPRESSFLSLATHFTSAAKVYATRTDLRIYMYDSKLTLVTQTTQKLFSFEYLIGFCCLHKKTFEI